MENFVVSARKYRPATFDTVVGQSHITITLKNAIRENRLAQAFLFCGPRGVGKTTCARILAKTINCLTPTPNMEACGQCDSCQSFQKNASLNVYELDAASNNGVDDIRNLVEQVRFPPQVGKRKVYIIDEVHMLSTGAFNAFLKTLEEPPSYVIFILATTERHKILPTILSRCQIFDFKRIEPQDISEHLQKIAIKEEIKASPEALDLIALKADGGLRDALSLFDMLATFSNNQITYQNAIDNLHILDYDYYFKMTDALMQENHTEAMLIFNEILKKGFDGHLFISGLAEHLRNLLVCKDEATIKLLETSQRVKQQYSLQAKQVDISFLLSALNLANQCDLNYKNSKNPKLHVELTLLKMAYLNAAISVAKGGANQENITLGEKKKPELTYANADKNNTTAQENTSNSQYAKTNNLKTTPKIETITQTQTTATKPPFNENTLKDVMRKFVLKLDADKTTPKEQQIFFQNAYVFIDNNQVVLKYPDAQTAVFEQLKDKLLAHLRHSFANPNLQITTQMQEKAIPNAKAYTATERFELLADKNKLIHQLTNDLGLEIKS